jgi:hypothetical protein
LWPKFSLIAILLLTGPALLAQTASVTGRVTDESGAIVQAATITLSSSSGTYTATSGADGTFSFPLLTPGDYTLAAAAPQLALPHAASLTLRPGANTFDLQLKVVASAQHVNVQDAAGPSVSTEASNNAGAIVLRGDDLDALSDDPEDLAADLQALAGPSAGPNGGAIFVDGFSGGQLPPKDSIREIRINQNPFSPEYDKLGLGRIEIFTKPGTDYFHGLLGYNLGSAVWNGRNPYAAQKAPFLLNEFENTASGPLNHRASFTLDFERHMVNNGSVTNGVTLNPQTLAPTPFTSVLTTPQRRWRVGPHIDYSLNHNNTLTLRYLFTYADVPNSGIGGFDLISRGYHYGWQYNTVQIAETSIHGASVNESRFQYYRTTNLTTANTIAPEIQVSGSFNGGGANTANGHDTQNSYEFQNNTSIVHGKHFWRFGVRLRGQTEDNYSPLNFNGTFTFSGGLAPELNATNQPLPVMIQISSIEQYRRTLLFADLPPVEIRALGGGASQFTISTGNPESSAGQMDAGLFAGDDWRLRPNLTLSLGLRYETQTNIHDRADFAPRIALAWAPGATAGKSSKTVLRAGFGIFYDRFALANTLAAIRYNSIVQQQYVFTDPDTFPAAPPLLSANRSTQAIEVVDAHLHAPSLMQSAATLERQLAKSTTLALTYTNSHGLHILRSADINAPLPANGIYPYPSSGPIFLMTSSGLYNQNQLIANFNSKVSTGLSLYGYYVFNRAFSNTDGLTTFPANPYNFSGEYGPAATDIHHRFILAGTVGTRWGIRLNPYLTMQSGAPFNITTGTDLYGTTLFNARPGIATNAGRPGVIETRYGLLDPDPVAGEPILGRNAGRGPWIVSMNLRLSKTWDFGPDATPGEAVTPVEDRGHHGIFSAAPITHRYRLGIGISARNLLNHTNPGPIVGSIVSPLFGQANQTYGQINGEGFSENASNRRLELQIRFAF